MTLDDLQPMNAPPLEARCAGAVRDMILYAARDRGGVVRQSGLAALGG